MKKIVLGSIALAVLASTHPALAGGEAVGTVYKDAVVPAPMWTGCYAGLNAGGAWGRESIRQTGDTTTVQPLINAGTIPASMAGDPSGFVGGGQLGCNYQSSQAVFGIETDFQWADVKKSQTVTVGAHTTEADQKMDYIGTLRLRAGFLPSNPWLLFVTGGMAYGHTKLSGTIKNAACTSGVCGTKSTTENPVGWTAGGGAEYMFSPFWSAKGEYLYYDLGEHSHRALLPGTAFMDQKVNFKGHIVRAGVNFKFWP